MNDAKGKMFDVRIRYLDGDNNPDEHLVSVGTDDKARAVAEQVKRDGFVFAAGVWNIVVPAHRVTQIWWPAPGNQIYRPEG